MNWMILVGGAGVSAFVWAVLRQSVYDDYEYPNLGATVGVFLVWALVASGTLLYVGIHRAVGG